MTKPFLAYRWNEGETTTITSYLSLSPFYWHWLSPYGQRVEERTLYVADVRKVKKYPCHMRKYISDIPRPCDYIEKWCSNEFIIKDSVPAIKLGEDIESLIRGMDTYFEELYENWQHLRDKETLEVFLNEQPRMKRIYQERTIALCEKRWREINENGNALS